MTAIGDDFPMMMEREAGLPDNAPPVSVAFGMYPKVDQKKSTEAGHDVYVDLEYVRIAIPGDKNSLYFQPATDQHRKRFPKSYEAFRNREKAPAVEGMRIEEWAPISRGTAMTMKALNIHTVEALASVHDGNIERLGYGARELREKAKAWLVDAQKGAAANALAADNKKLTDQIAAMQAQMNAMQSRLTPTPAATVQPVPDPTADVEHDVAAAARRPRRGG